VKRICTVWVAALSVACGASESHNSSQSGATARAGIAEPDNQPKVTLTGCLQNADKPNAVGTTGTDRRGSAGQAADQMAAGKGSPGERFTLTNAKALSGATDPSAGSYLLDGNLEALRGNLDRQVRVTGTLDAAYANSPQRVRVDSVDALADSCTQR
jgi:hypothetical protein